MTRPNRRFSVFLVTVLLAWSAPARAEFALVLDPTGVAAEDVPKLEDYLKETAAHIPEKMRATLNRPITIRFDRMAGDTAEPIQVSCAETSSAPPFVAGKVNQDVRGKSSTIVLNRRLIPEIDSGEAGSRKIDCGHMNLYRYSEAALLHEVTHLYNDAAQLSQRPQFRSLTGWTTEGGTETQKNQLRSRSPNQGEYKSPQEAASVLLEYFALDPEFECRKPALYRYFVKEFEQRPFPEGSCKKNYQVFLAGSNTPVSVDPKRIYEIQYFKPSRGDAFISRWGHSMLKLVICDPKREVVGPDCEKDVASHLVVGYQANVDDFKLGTMKGLTGKYPSQLQVYRLADAIDMYNDTELRDIESPALDLTEDQKNHLAEQILDQFWNYSGKYKFFANNCATEAQGVVSAALEDSHPFHKESTVMTPNELLDLFKKDQLIKRDLPSDLSALIREGYYFPSKQKQRLIDAFNVLKPLLKDSYPDKTPPVSLEDYLKNTTAKDRKALMARLLPRFGSQPEIGAALFLLEAQLYQKQEKHYRAQFLSVLESESEKNTQAGKDIRDYFNLLRGLDPRKRLTSDAGYGVPLESEINPCAYAGEEDRISRLNFTNLREVLKAELSENRSELLDCSVNLKFLKEHSTTGNQD